MDEQFMLKIEKENPKDEIRIAEEVFKLTLRAKQKEIIKEFFKTSAEGKPLYEEYMLVCGKKGGKTFLTAVMNLILVYKVILMEDFFKRFGLVPQDVYLLNTCAGKDQAIEVYLNQVKGIVTLSPFLQHFKAGMKTDEIKFRIPGYENFLILKAQSSRSTSSLGYLCYSVTFDELAWFQDSSNRTCSKESYAALFPNIKPFGGFGYSFILSSPNDTGSWFYSHYEFAKASNTKMVIKYPTWVMNPNITRESLEEEFIRDYDKAMMDWGAEFIEAVGGAFVPERIEEAMCLDVRDIGVKDKRERIIALDPGLKHDAYALAMGYSEDHKVYIDYVTYWIGSRDNPVKISDVEEHIRFLCSNYIVNKIVLDQRYSASTIQRLSAEGFPIFETFFDGGYKQRMYQCFKEKLNMKELFLPRDGKVRGELMALRRKGSGANIRYEAPTAGPVKTDDMADAIANCIFQLELLNEELGGCDAFSLDGDIIGGEPEEKMNAEDLKKAREEEAIVLKKIEEEGGFMAG